MSTVQFDPVDTMSTNPLFLRLAPARNAGVAASEHADELGDRWRSARDQAVMAYRIWCDAPRADKRDAYAAYLAAVDREDASTEELRSGAVLLPAAT